METVLLRTSDAKPYVIEAMEDLLEGMEFELGVRLNRCAAGGALNGKSVSGAITWMKADVRVAGAAGLVHGSGSNGQDVANSQSYKAYKKPDDPVQVGYKAYTPRGGTH